MNPEDLLANARRLIEARPTNQVAAGERRVATIEELPQVVLSGERDSFLAAGLALLDAPNPYYLPHNGVNGAEVEILGRTMVNFAGYNYLGLAGDPRVQAAAAEAIGTFGTSASAARLIGGELPLHAQLEERLAAAYQVDDAVVTGSGFLTNAAALAFLLGEGDLAVCDSLVHNSIVSGTRWAGCRRMSFQHNDPDALEALLSRSRRHFGTALVVLEGVYSMDGDVAALPELVEVARRHECFVMVDEAHSFGVLGETGAGIHEHTGLAGTDVDLWMGTLSKSMASYGGYLAGSRELMAAMKMSAAGISLYAAAPPPAQMAAAGAAFDIMLAEPGRLKQLRDNQAQMLGAARAAGLDTGLAQPGTPLVPVITGGTETTMRICLALLDQGIHTTAIVHPAVAETEGRLRFFVTSEHTPEQIRRAVAATARLMA
ncbi:aminotransferase class I/II-fold pyridoxal phosphate-dependent enzyme [Kineosporia babensis]|uniref:8-amino-7-oxononanoate synthase n=1 Tax=Kineosporia babensis TaxID=499548 RepID=A0A9X1STD1_9ACTN|nr:aminotransferase class I/II-fold pyridoxal phosphate-dependent enzyme [Kineosporia babensis]MCD5310510.1 aminotransferase class I/II-fold pyridoxal phosphate-dependent enzyme [Kineosporia babensis]